MKDLLTRVYEQFEKYVPRQRRLAVFAGAVFFIIIGVISSSTLLLDQLTAAFSLVQTKIVPVKQEPVISYPTQDILIDTPFATALSIKEPIFPDHVCSITDFGAVPGGKTSNTEAFRKAITACAEAGGGKVLVPPGTWLTGPIHLESNIDLSIERDATILFSTNFNDYLPAVFSRFEGIEYMGFTPPISATNSTNVAITGVGTIDGQGALSWWKMKNRATPNINTLYTMGDNNAPLTERVSGSETTGLRPAFIEFTHCHHVLVENIKIHDGPMWTIHPLYSDHVIIRGVAIETNPGPSTDGVALDSSSYVLIENSTFDTGDDAIVLKSGRDKEGMRIHRPTENIVIRNNTIKDAHAAVAIGSEMSGDVRNVFVTDIDIRTAQFAFRIKATTGRGGIVENIWAQNFFAYNLSDEAIQITTDYGLPFGPDSVALPTFRNIDLSTFTIRKTSRAISITGLEMLPIKSVTLNDLSINARYGIDLNRTQDIQLKNIRIIQTKKDPLLTLRDSQHVTIDTVQCLVTTPDCLILGGATSDTINISRSGLEKKRIRSLPEVKPEAIIYQ